MNAARDLRNQADNVESALSQRIACMDEMRIRLENDLHQVYLLSLTLLYSFFLVVIVC